MYIGDDLIIMVVNEGEIDLYLNFACSCKANNLDLKKVFVFSASSEMITVIESTGAMGIYHEGTYVYVHVHLDMCVHI
jgi:hypothetical protein